MPSPKDIEYWAKMVTADAQKASSGKTSDALHDAWQVISKGTAAVEAAGDVVDLLAGASEVSILAGPVGLVAAGIIITVAIGVALYDMFSRDEPPLPPDLRPILPLDAFSGPPAYWIVNGPANPTQAGVGEPYITSAGLRGGPLAPGQRRPHIVIFEWAMPMFVAFLRQAIGHYASGMKFDKKKDLDTHVNDTAANWIKNASLSHPNGHIFFEYGTTFPALDYREKDNPASTHDARYLGRDADCWVRFSELASQISAANAKGPGLLLPNGFRIEATLKGFTDQFFSQFTDLTFVPPPPDAKDANMHACQWWTGGVSDSLGDPFGSTPQNIFNSVIDRVTAWKQGGTHGAAIDLTSKYFRVWNLDANRPLLDDPNATLRFSNTKWLSADFAETTLKRDAVIHSRFNPWRVPYKDANSAYPRAPGVGEAGLSPSYLLTGPTIWGDASLVNLRYMNWGDPGTHTPEEVLGMCAWEALIKTQLFCYAPFPRAMKSPPPTDPLAPIMNWSKLFQSITGSLKVDTLPIPVPNGKGVLEVWKYLNDPGGMMDSWSPDYLAATIESHHELVDWALNGDGDTSKLTMWNYVPLQQADPKSSAGKAITVINESAAHGHTRHVTKALGDIGKPSDTHNSGTNHAHAQPPREPRDAAGAHTHTDTDTHAHTHTDTHDTSSSGSILPWLLVAGATLVSPPIGIALAAGLLLTSGSASKTDPTLLDAHQFEQESGVYLPRDVDRSQRLTVAQWTALLHGGHS